MSNQRSGCETRNRKARKELELLNIKSKCSIINYIISNKSNLQSCMYNIYILYTYKYFFIFFFDLPVFINYV